MLTVDKLKKCRLYTGIFGQGDGREFKHLQSGHVQEHPEIKWIWRSGGKYPKGAGIRVFMVGDVEIKDNDFEKIVEEYNKLKQAENGSISTSIESNNKI